MGSPKFHELLKKMGEIHDKKSHDYASTENPFQNFERSSEIVSWFKSDNDKVFAAIIGIKLARLSELLNGKEPQNESIEDSFIDCANYVLLWASSHSSTETEGLRLHLAEFDLNSMEAASQIIKLTEHLTISDKQILRDYLSGQIRDDLEDVRNRTD